MGENDQLGKEVFALETARVTRQGCRWEAPRELPLGSELHPDGGLRVVDAEVLRGLPPPWCLLSAGAAVVELKMDKDRPDLEAWRRARVRRSVWDLIEHLGARRQEQERARVEGRTAAHIPWVADAELMFVAPHVPGWLRRGPELTLCGEGVYRVERADGLALWVAANELPLDPALIPFLQVRTGRARIEFITWLLQTGRWPTWGYRYVETFKMTIDEIATLEDPNAAAEDVDEFDIDFDSYERPWAKRAEVYRLLFKKIPGLPEHLYHLTETTVSDEALQQKLDEGFDKGRVEELQRLFGRRLKRPLTEDEVAVFHARVLTLGLERMEDVVLDLDREALGAWMADPDAG